MINNKSLWKTNLLEKKQQQFIHIHSGRQNFLIFNVGAVS